MLYTRMAGSDSKDCDIRCMLEWLVATARIVTYAVC